GPVDPAATDVPVPTSDPGQMLRFGQKRLAPRQRRGVAGDLFLKPLPFGFRPLLFRDVVETNRQTLLRWEGPRPIPLSVRAVTGVELHLHPLSGRPPEHLLKGAADQVRKRLP